MIEHMTPSDIERTSLSIIASELEAMGIVLPAENAAVIKRVIHASADFDYAKHLQFTSGACNTGIRALSQGACIVTDTNMARAGISTTALERLGGRALCHMAEADIAREARQQGTTRAVAAMHKAARENPGCVLAIGNAPTALLEITRLIGNGLRPALVVAVPVGFVNVVEAKETVYKACTDAGIAYIAAMGRKGGSTIAAAIVNALLYAAADMTDPARRGWN